MKIKIVPVEVDVFGEKKTVDYIEINDPIVKLCNQGAYSLLVYADSQGMKIGEQYLYFTNEELQNWIDDNVLIDLVLTKKGYTKIEEENANTI